MKRSLRFALSCIILVACPGTAAETPKTIPPSQFFPLAKGTTWAYRGPVEWQVGTEVKQRVMFWMMEVKETVETGGILAARIMGHPDDMIWYEEGKSPSERVIFWNGREYYNAQSVTAWGNLVDSMDKGGNDLSADLGDDSLLLPLPLTQGLHWGDAGDPSRDDFMYRWNVEEIKEKTLTGIKGVDPAKPVKTALVTYRCLGSHEFIDYAEGIGIIRYRFGHHGTVSECDMKLVEYRSGK